MTVGQPLKVIDSMSYFVSFLHETSTENVLLQGTGSLSLHEHFTYVCLPNKMISYGGILMEIFGNNDNGKRNQ